MSEQTIKTLKDARRISTPIVTILTADQQAMVEQIRDGFNNSVPLVTWDVIRSVRAVNSLGEEAARRMIGDVDPMALTNPDGCLAAAMNLPAKSMLLMHNAHRHTENVAFTQAIANLRDAFKANMRMLVLLAPAITFPEELIQDPLAIQDDLPGTEQLWRIVSEGFQAVNFGLDKAGRDRLKDLDEATMTRAVDALRGLAVFPAEQVTAMSFRPEGLDLEAMWERKRQVINATPGLKVWRGGERFSDIGGVENAKRFLKAVINGKRPPRAIVFIDEIEKALAGAGTTPGAGDSSGVSQKQLGKLLTYMQDNEAAGCIFIGPPGSAKSMAAKAMGGEAGVPTIALDLAGTESSLVGESSKRLEAALQVITAVSSGRALFLATCNSIGALPPELRRRFTMGTFFFDLPTAEEREVIWMLYLGKYSFKMNTKRPDDEGWTGAEIRQCVERAYELSISLVEAAKFVVPVSVSAGEQIRRLREQASGRFLSASQSGIYTFGGGLIEQSKGRSISVEE